ncbi:MAG: hypothetical protein INR73_19860 [Williamsia sp.]|nr:hypothetical protein [Williamsia sp.]
MLARFIEFMTYHEKEICLYVMRDEDGQGCFLFNVNVIDGTSNELLLCKKIDDNWENLTQNAPHWVKEIEPAIILVIERKIGSQQLKCA